MTGLSTLRRKILDIVQTTTAPPVPRSAELLRDLTARRWTPADIADAAGLTIDRVRRLLWRAPAEPGELEAIEAAYAELAPWEHDPDALDEAAVLRYMAGDPPERKDTTARREAIRRLHDERGESIRSIVRRLGVPEQIVVRDIREYRSAASLWTG